MIMKKGQKCKRKVVSKGHSSCTGNKIIKVKPTSDSRLKALARKNRRREKELDRIRQATVDRRSRMAQKRREKAFRLHDLQKMQKAKKSSVMDFLLNRRLDQSNIGPLTGRQRRKQEAEATRYREESMRRRAKANRVLKDPQSSELDDTIP